MVATNCRSSDVRAFGDQTYSGQDAHGRWLEKNAERGIDACADAAKAGLDQRVSAGIGA